MAIRHQHIDSFQGCQGQTSTDWLPMRWSVPIAIVMAVPLVNHDLGAVPVIPTPVRVPIPVSLAYLYPNAADPEIGALRDDYRFVDSDRGTGKCRHGEEWNNTEGKNSFLHGTLLVWDVRRPDPRQYARMCA